MGNVGRFLRTILFTALHFQFWRLILSTPLTCTFLLKFHSFSLSFASLKDRNKWCTKDNQNVRILSSVWHYLMMISVNNSWRSWFLLYRNKYVKGILVLFAPSHIFTSYKVEYFPALIFFASFPLRNFQKPSVTLFIVMVKQRRKYSSHVLKRVIYWGQLSLYTFSFLPQFFFLCVIWQKSN